MSKQPENPPDFDRKKLPTEVKLKVVDCVLEREKGESWGIWEASRQIRDLCERVEAAKNYRQGIMGF